MWNIELTKGTVLATITLAQYSSNVWFPKNSNLVDLNLNEALLHTNINMGAIKLMDKNNDKKRRGIAGIILYKVNLLILFSVYLFNPPIMPRQKTGIRPTKQSYFQWIGSLNIKIYNPKIEVDTSIINI